MSFSQLQRLDVAAKRGAVAEALDEHLALVREMPPGPSADQQMVEAIALRRQRAKALVRLEALAWFVALCGGTGSAVVAVAEAVRVLAG